MIRYKSSVFSILVSQNYYTSIMADFELMIFDRICQSIVKTNKSED